MAEMFAEGAVAEALDKKLAATEDLKEVLIVVVEEVEATRIASFSGAANCFA